MSASPTEDQQRPRPDDFSAAQEINWDDFRDHLATADQEGNRRWLYPKKVRGRFYRLRTYVSWLLLAILFTGPFIRIHGNPLLMINIVSRRFCILGNIFWPQDMAIFAVALLIFLTGIIIFTTAFGRLWCGWTCPQTLLMEMLFRKIEYAIEGDAPAQRALDAAPWSARKLLKKTGKHTVFLALSFLIGNTLLSYIIGSDQLMHIITDDPLNHLRGLISMILFTLLFYAIFARFREQACTFICPYGRFQSAILDENTMVVAFALEGTAITLWLVARRNPILFVLLSGLVFFGWGEIFSLFPSTLTDTFGTKHATANYGCLYMAQGVGSVLGGPVAALLHQSTGSWIPVFAVIITMDFTTAALAIALLKPMRRRWLGAASGREVVQKLRSGIIAT
jgi:hypothetical protein